MNSSQQNVSLHINSNRALSLITRAHLYLSPSTDFVTYNTFPFLISDILTITPKQIKNHTFNLAHNYWLKQTHKYNNMHISTGGDILKNIHRKTQQKTLSIPIYHINDTTQTMRLRARLIHNRPRFAQIYI